MSNMPLERWLDPSTPGPMWQRWIDFMNQEKTSTEVIAQARESALKEARQHPKSVQLELRQLRRRAGLNETA